MGTTELGVNTSNAMNIHKKWLDFQNGSKICQKPVNICSCAHKVLVTNKVAEKYISISLFVFHISHFMFHISVFFLHLTFFCFTFLVSCFKFLISCFVCF